SAGKPHFEVAHFQHQRRFSGCIGLCLNECGFNHDLPLFPEMLLCIARRTSGRLPHGIRRQELRTVSPDCTPPVRQNHSVDDTYTLPGVQTATEPCRESDRGEYAQARSWEWISAATWYTDVSDC